MQTFICFNDESGSWQDKKRYFYIRTSLIIKSIELKKIENEMIQLRKDFEIDEIGFCNYIIYMNRRMRGYGLCEEYE